MGAGLVQLRAEIALGDLTAAPSAYEEVTEETEMGSS